MSNEGADSIVTDSCSREVPTAMEVRNEPIGCCDAAVDPKSQEQREGTGFLARMSTFVATAIPPGGIAASAFNIASSTVGAGIVGLPSAANSSGLVMAIVYLIIITVMTIFSIYALGVAADKTKTHDFEGVAKVLFGAKGSYLVAATRAFHGFSACVAYIISVGDILSAILKGTDAPNFLKEKWGNRLLTFIMWLCFMLPLTIPREVNSLRYVSTFAVVFIFYLMVVIVVHSCMNGLPENIKNVHVTGAPGDEGIHLFGTSNRAVEGPGVFTFAFVCQCYAFEIYFGMAKPSAHRFTAYSAIAMGICLVLCVMTAFFGYLDFGGEVTGSVLLMYDPVKEPAILVGFVGVLTKLFASYALLAMSCRNGLCGIVEWDAEKLSFFKHCTIIGILSIIMLLCGLFIPNINTVFGFVGSVCGGFLGFILPSLFMMYGGNWSLSTVGWLHYIATYAVLFAGVALSVFGTGATIYGVAVGW